METMLLIGLAVTALAALSWYVQRAYQGYLYANSAGQGPQFDPTQPSTDTKTLGDAKTPGFTSNQLITVKVAAPSYTLPEGGCLPGACLPDRPGGTVIGRLLRTTTKSQSSFTVGREATFDAQ